MTLQPYYLLPIKTRTRPGGQGAAMGSARAPFPQEFTPRQAPQVFPSFQDAISNKTLSKRPIIKRQTIQNQQRWRRHQLVCPPWRAVQRYLWILQVLQMSANAATSISATNAWICTASNFISGSLPKIHPKHGQHDIHTGHSTAALLR